MRLKNKTALITGAGRGMKSDCLGFARNKVDVIINELVGSDYAEEGRQIQKWVKNHYY
jgi:NAD(P)-dependent dehydrogenase (short-subunit alcohol dehydrogenase family)